GAPCDCDPRAARGALAPDAAFVAGRGRGWGGLGLVVPSQRVAVWAVGQPSARRRRHHVDRLRPGVATMTLSEFLAALEDGIAVLLPDARPPQPADVAAAADTLRSLDRHARLEMAFHAPSLELASSAWAAV